MDKLIARIEDIADKASKDSGTSYEDYIQLFTTNFDKTFKRHFQYHRAVKLHSIMAMFQNLNAISDDR